MAWDAGTGGGDYVLLADALEDGFAGVEERSACGTVSEVWVENRGSQPLLIPAGEELLGAGRGRFASRSLLVPAKSSRQLRALRIPKPGPSRRASRALDKIYR